MNSILILLTLIAHGASPQEANEELAVILSRNPSVEYIPLSSEMLKYDEIYWNEEILIAKY